MARPTADTTNVQMPASSASRSGWIFPRGFGVSDIVAACRACDGMSLPKVATRRGHAASPVGGCRNRARVLPAVVTQFAPAADPRRRVVAVLMSTAGVTGIDLVACTAGASLPRKFMRNGAYGCGNIHHDSAQLLER